MKIDKSFSIQPQDPATRKAAQETQLRSAAKLYEQHFLNEMVKSMRSTIHRENGLMPPNMAENIFTEQLDQQYVENWADKGGIGLADMIYQQIHERIFPNKKDFSKPQGPIPFEKSGPMKVKVDGKGQGSAQVFFQGDEGQPFAQSIPAVNPWDGKIKSATTANGWSHIRVAHENGLESQLSFLGSLADLKEGQSVVSGETLGILPPGANAVLRWNIETS